MENEDKMSGENIKCPDMVPEEQKGMTEEERECNHIFQFSTHECVTFSRFYMQEVNTEIQFAVHTDNLSFEKFNFTREDDEDD